jgi:nucleoside-diphosphate-sugar epimerase
MTGSKLHVVLGASGGVGAAVVQELVGRGHRVRAVSRRGSADLGGAVEVLAADVADPDGARQACRGAAVVYHCAAPPYTTWSERFPAMTAAVTDGAAAADAKLVFADNLYAYGPVDGPITEDTPQRGTGTKARVRAAMADGLLAAHAAGRLPVAIGRAADYYGPGGRNSAVGERLFDAALRGRRVRWLGRLDMPHTLSYLEDLARGLVTLGSGRRPTARSGTCRRPRRRPAESSSSWSSPSWGGRPASG